MEIADKAAVLQQLETVKQQLEQLKEKGREAVGGVLETARVCKRFVGDCLNRFFTRLSLIPDHNIANHHAKKT